MSGHDTKSFAAAVAGAVALAATMVPLEASGANKGKEKCWGVAKAGENGCASADGAHGCGGESKIDYNGQEWMLVETGTCDKMGGKLEPFVGIGKPIPIADAPKKK